MNQNKEIQQALLSSIQELAEDRSEIAIAQLEKPPKPELGDWAYPCFSLAKILRKAPPLIAQELQKLLQKHLPDWQIECSGAYLNFRLPRAVFASNVLQNISKAKEEYGHNSDLSGQKIMIEFSSPNTNKPLHLGHLRNDVLGESISRILKACDAELNKVIIINDRGVHICKSMLAYQRFGQREDAWETPENTGIRGDFLVGNYYVRFNNWSKEAQEENNGEDPEYMALEMLKDWERGKSDVQKLWQTMRQWVLDGIQQTYQRCDISFDRYYSESETYKLGQDLVAEGLKRNIFQRREDGAVYIDLSEQKLDQKVVQRSDGTSVYITQDLGTAVARHEDFPFDRQIYVVGNEQDYHFKVLFEILRQFGYPWAQQLFHLSYGMVVLPDGKMKSREGTVVDADILLDQLEELALEGLRERGREAELGVEASAEVAQKVALGALHFYLLQFNPQRDISFNPRESLAFQGNTGPYLQYVGARIHSILKKAGASATLDSQRLESYPEQAWQTFQSPAEWELLKQLRDFPSAVQRAAEELNPAHLVKSLAEIARCFSRFYHDVPILSSEEPVLSMRLDLCRATLQTLQNGMNLAVIPFLESM